MPKYITKITTITTRTSNHLQRKKIYKLKVMDTKPDEPVNIISCEDNMKFEFVAPMEYKKELCEPEKKNAIGGTVDVMPTNMNLPNETDYTISDLQTILGDIREKYTLAIDKLMHKRRKLQMKELNQQYKYLTVTGDQTLVIPDFEVPTKVGLQWTDAEATNLEALKNRIKRQMDVMETLYKMKNCPMAQAMLQL